MLVIGDPCQIGLQSLQWVLGIGGFSMLLLWMQWPHADRPVKSLSPVYASSMFCSVTRWFQVYSCLHGWSVLLAFTVLLKLTARWLTGISTTTDVCVLLWFCGFFGIFGHHKPSVGQVLNHNAAMCVCIGTKPRWTCVCGKQSVSSLF